MMMKKTGSTAFLKKSSKKFFVTLQPAGGSAIDRSTSSSRARAAGVAIQNRTPTKSKTAAKLGIGAIVSEARKPGSGLLRLRLRVLAMTQSVISKCKSVTGFGKATGPVEQKFFGSFFQKRTSTCLSAA
jgi:hypothetical protein